MNKVYLGESNFGPPRIYFAANTIKLHNVIYQPVKNSRGNRFGAYAFGKRIATSSYILKRSSTVAKT